jgi:hypothetical protein
MITMNRCKARFDALFFVALCAIFAPAVTFFPSTAAAQNADAPGGRNFPEGTLRGSFMVVNYPEIQVDGQTERLAPGARIRSAQNMFVMPAAITGQKLLVNYTRDAAGLVREVWVLTPDEARTKRATADRPFLNFWPFVADSGPRDDGKTPFDQLPKYGQ